jgi:hypothetical protein
MPSRSRQESGVAEYSLDELIEELDRKDAQ